MLKPALFIAAVSMLLALPGAPAAADAHLFEVTPFAGYRFGGSFRGPEADDGTRQRISIDEDFAAGVILNIPSEYPTEWEFLFSHQSTALRTGGVFEATDDLELDISYFQAGGIYLFEEGRARPYIGATLGATHFSPRGSEAGSETFFSFSIGGGYRIRATPRLALRVDLRAFGTVIDSDRAVFCEFRGEEASRCGVFARSGSLVWQWQAFAGLAWRFGGTPARSPTHR